ncbi:MAG TPA: hypothetical protein VKG22_07490 [Stellaceae bacterium]|nr:hypothetical protein [Stellaceae bacterium]HMD66473.1 hypothetical protein [Stellaceae bacterium]
MPPDTARYRTESRGGHARADYPERDDLNWLNHTLAWRDDAGRVRLGDRPGISCRCPTGPQPSRPPNGCPEAARRSVSFAYAGLRGCAIPSMAANLFTATQISVGTWRV